MICRLKYELFTVHCSLFTLSLSLSPNLDIFLYFSVRSSTDNESFTGKNN